LEFYLDKRLEEDTFALGDLPLCKVLLMNVSDFPWIIVVPRLANIIEIFDLSTSQQENYRKEITYMASKMSKLYKSDKMNIASLGNIVSQFHTHIIARYKDDAAWPKPVWSLKSMKKYKKEDSIIEIDKLKRLVDDYHWGENNE